MYIPVWPALNPTYFLRRETHEEPPFPLDRPDNTYFYVARNGIYHLMRSLGVHKGGTVLVPDYHHGNEIYAMRAAGAKLRYYPIKKNLEADLDAVARLCKTKPQILYVTHFIGWPQPMAEIQALCRENGITLIEDCALSFMSEVGGVPLGTFGDYSVFCLYKTVPVPNGGVLVRNTQAQPGLDELSLHHCNRLSLASRVAELMFQWLRSRYEFTGRCLFGLKRAAGRTLTAARIGRMPVGGTGFDVFAATTGMSPISHRLIRRFEYDRIKKTRRRNFQILQQRLEGRVALLENTLSDGVCPLFFPLLVSEKRTAAHLLRQRGIQTIEFWNNGVPEGCREKSDAEFLRRHLLEVPIHQDLDIDEVEYVARVICESRIGLAA